MESSSIPKSHNEVMPKVITHAVTEPASLIRAHKFEWKDFHFRAEFQCGSYSAK